MHGSDTGTYPKVMRTPRPSYLVVVWHAIQSLYQVGCPLQEHLLREKDRENVSEEKLKNP